MKSFTVTKWNAPKLVGKIPKILKDYGTVLGPQLQQEIKTKQFAYPVFTLRKSGEEVPRGIRNIVDTGDLAKSQGPSVVAKNKLTITYGADYSKAVLEGGYVVGTVLTFYVAPERDWITPALNNQPLLPYFVAKWKELKIS